VFKLEKGLRQIANAMHDNPKDTLKDTHKPNFLYTNYSYMEHHISELCELREGSSCCVDKARFIIKMYLKYALTGEIPDFNPSIEKWNEPNFGTYQEWIDLCDGLYKLYYGKPEDYFKSYNKLIQSELRKYKHILHTWYIKFNDGEIIKVYETWDKDTENPLENEAYSDNNNYFVMKRYLMERIKKGISYEIDDETNLFEPFCKVPKNEIKEIYKTSKEIYL